MVDHGLEISPQLKVARIQVGGFRRPSFWKFPADYSVITEMAAEILFHACVAMCGGASTCINTVVASHHLAWRAGIMDCCNNETYRWPVMVHVMLPVAWNKCIAAISVMTESSSCNLLDLDFLDPLTYIFAAICCEDISRPRSTEIPTHLYLTLQKI